VQYFNYGRWRRVVCREHRGTVNLRYLAPSAAVLALAGGLAAGVAGLAAAIAGPAGAGGPGLAWLMTGFVVPASYLGVTGMAARRLPVRVLAGLPVALVTMHVCWGAGFLTSPRRLLPGRARSGPA
jgi:hypothetical protein